MMLRPHLQPLRSQPPDRRRPGPRRRRAARPGHLGPARPPRRRLDPRQRGPARSPRVEAVRNRARVPRRTSPLHRNSAPRAARSLGLALRVRLVGQPWTGRGARLPSPFVARRRCGPATTTPVPPASPASIRTRDPLRHVGQGEHRRANSTTIARIGAPSVHAPWSTSGGQTTASPGRHPRPLVADADPAAALDHDEVAASSGCVWGVIRAPRSKASSAMTPVRPALDDLALDPGGPGRAVRAAMADPEPADLDRHRRPARRRWSTSRQRRRRRRGRADRGLGPGEPLAREVALLGQLALVRPEVRREADEPDPDERARGRRPASTSTMIQSNRNIAVHEHQPEGDHARPQDPLVHLQVDAVPVQLAGADVVEDHRRDQRDERRDGQRHVQVREVDRR